MKLRTICLACTLCLLLLLLPLAACTPKVVAEPTVTPAQTPLPTQTPAPAETLETLLSGLTAADIGYLFWGGPNESITAEELAPMLREASKHTIDHAPMTLNGTDTDIVWTMEIYIGEKSQGAYGGEDAIYLSAGLEENIVEVFAGANLPHGRVWLEDEALYQLLRTQNDTPNGEIDQDAYAAYRDTVDAYLARPLPELDGVTFTREMIELRQVAEAPKLGALVYSVADVYYTDPPVRAIYTLAGGDYVDSRLRVHGVNGANNLVVVDGIPVGFVSWEWLASDGLARYSTAEELIEAAERQFVNFS